MSRFAPPWVFVFAVCALFWEVVIVQEKRAFGAEPLPNPPKIKAEVIKSGGGGDRGKAGGSGKALGVHTLEQALSEAYLHNPDLDLARVALRQTDEGVAQALSAWRPSITGDLSQTHQRIEQGGPSSIGVRGRGAGVEVRQSIFSGGGTYASTRKAENDVFAGREDLLDKEQQTLFLTVQVYVDVLSKVQIVEFLRASEKVLDQTVAQTEARYVVGEVTRTEVAAAQAKAAEAVARRASAEGDFETACATFTKVVGRPPGNLAVTRVLIPLPKTRDEAIQKALSESPSLKSLVFKEKSSEYGVGVETAHLLPQIDAAVRAERRLQTHTSPRRDLSLTLSVTIPIYDRGLSRSRVRQAEQGVSAAHLNTERGRRALIEAMTKAWESLAAALESIKQYALQVTANELALKGAREEYSLGQKSLLDVLQIENDLRQAQISWVGAKANATVLSYQVLLLMGQLTAKRLKLDVSYYDPEKYYEEYHDAWFSLGREEDKNSFSVRPSSPVPHD